MAFGNLFLTDTSWMWVFCVYVCESQSNSPRCSHLSLWYGERISFIGVKALIPIVMDWIVPLKINMLKL